MVLTSVAGSIMGLPHLGQAASFSLTPLPHCEQVNMAASLLHDDECLLRIRSPGGARFMPAVVQAFVTRHQLECCGFIFPHVVIPVRDATALTSGSA